MKKTSLAIRVLSAVMAFTMVAGGNIIPGNGIMTALASDKAVDWVYLGEPKYVWWETDTVGKWSSVSKAHEYQVKLYIADNIERDEDNWRKIDWDNEELEAVVTKRTGDQSCDFTEYMKDQHSYFFVVRATPKISEQGYVSSGNWVASPELDFKGQQVQGITEGKWRNYREGSKFEAVDGNELGGGWHLIRGTWYLFDENGCRLNDWQSMDGSRYYLGTDGRMATGWFVYGDNWYYADKSGVIQTGWVMDQPGKYYYMYEDGTMAHDIEIEGYWLSSSGLRVEMQS